MLSGERERDREKECVCLSLCMCVAKRKREVSYISYYGYYNLFNRRSVNNVKYNKLNTQIRKAHCGETRCRFSCSFKIGLRQRLPFYQDIKIPGNEQ